MFPTATEASNGGAIGTWNVAQVSNMCVLLADPTWPVPLGRSHVADFTWPVPLGRSHLAGPTWPISLAVRLACFSLPASVGTPVRIARRVPHECVACCVRVVCASHDLCMVMPRARYMGCTPHVVGWDAACALSRAVFVRKMCFGTPGAVRKGTHAHEWHR